MLYLRVYNSIVNLIYSGKLRKGDRVPSIAAISEEYEVSVNTARTVVNMLYENGLIDKAPRRPSTVAFDLSGPEHHEQMARMIAERKSVILDAYRARSLIMPSLAAANAALCDETDWNRMEELCSRLRGSGLECMETAQRLSAELVSRLYNPLAASFVEMTDMSLTVPFLLLEKERARLDWFCRLVDGGYSMTCELMRERRMDRLRQQVFCMYKLEGLSLANMLQDLEREKETSAGIRRLNLSQSEHLYISVAFDLFEKIVGGEYRRGEFLPAAAVLSELYEVSLSTVKKACRYLCEMGLVQIMNGRGIRVTFSLPADRSREFIREKILPNIAGYFQAIQVLYLIVGNLCEYAVVCAHLGERAAGMERSFAFMPLTILDLAAASIDCGFLDNFYMILKRNIIWGIYLIGEKSGTRFNALSRMGADALESLDSPAVFARKMEGICARLFGYSQTACEQLGLPYPERIC